MFKPLLAPGDSPETRERFFDELKFPLLGSWKLDGVRCVVKDGVAYSRSFKPLPSLQVQEDFNHLEHVDGELIEGDPASLQVYNRSVSHVMSSDKPGDVRYYVFDYTHPDWLERPFRERLRKLEEVCSRENNVFIIEQRMLHSLDQLFEMEKEALEMGYEGLMLRSPDAPYKCGRGTFREGIIYKLKRSMDAEGVIVDMQEAQTNLNELETDELGYAKRSQRKGGLVAADTLGAFVVEWEGTRFNVSPGKLTHEERLAIWKNADRYLGRLLKFRYFGYGSKDKPRFPRALGFRDGRDT